MKNSPSKLGINSSQVAYAAIVLALFGLISWVLCLIGGYSLLDALGLAARRSYQPHHNFMTYIYINGLSITFYLFLMIGVSAFICKAAAPHVHIELLKPYTELSLSAHLRRITTAAIIIMFVMQLNSIYGYWRNAGKIFGHKAGYMNTNIQKTKAIADTLRTVVDSKPYKATLATDLNMEGGAGLLKQHILAYFLHPVDISGASQKEEDAWVAFHKEDAARHVPEGYTIVHQINEQNLIALKDR